MENQTRSNWQKQLVFAAIAIVFLFAANSFVFGQINYKVGEKIEVLYSKSSYEAKIIEAKDGQFKIKYDDGSPEEWVKPDRMRPIPNFATAEKVKVGDKVLVRYSPGLNIWNNAEVLEIMPDGRYRARLEGGPIEGKYEISQIRLISGETTSVGGETAAVNDKNKPGETTTDKANENQPAKNPINNATKYKPGDRVECDKAQMGIWEKGTVMAFLPDDTNKDSGRFYRVRLDSFVKGGLYMAGHECVVNAIRPISEAPLKASGKYKVGDQIEAQNSNLSWLPAKIIAVEGAFYKVRFESRDERYDETIDDIRIRKIGGEKAKTADASKTTTLKTAGAATSLPGSAWSLRLYRKSKGYSADGTIMTTLFCPNGTWDTVRYGLSPGNAGAVGQRGTYKVAGKTLTLQNGQGGQTETYTITWLNAKTVELSDGSDIIWRLFDGVKSDCK